MQKYSLLDVWRYSEYACVKIASGNVLCHNSNYLSDGIFRIPTWFKDNVSFFRIFLRNWIDKLSSKNCKRQRLIAFIFVNTMQYPRTLKNNIYHSNIREPPPFFLFEYQYLAKFWSMFLAMCWLKWSHSFFCGCLSLMILHFRNLFFLSTRVARMLLTQRRVSSRKDVNSY